MAWVYRQVAGIDTSPTAPAFQEIVIHPRPDGSMNHAHGEYESVYGMIMTDWTYQVGGPFSLKVKIPANTTAKVFLPQIADTQITQNGKKIVGQPESGMPMVRIGSGSYEFLVTKTK
jgi:alpha-L-rhamnosidase